MKNIDDSYRLTIAKIWIIQRCPDRWTRGTNINWPEDDTGAFAETP